MSIKNKTLAKPFLKKLIKGRISFGRMLWAHRMGEEMTLKEFSKILNISKQELCNIEKGQKFVSLERGMEFAKKLGDSKKIFAKYILEDRAHRAGLKVEVRVKDTG